MARLSIDTLNQLDRDAFVEVLGEIFEHSPWVAEGTVASRPFASPEALLQALCGVVFQAGEGRQLELIRAHPDLAGKAAIGGDLTPSSRREQAGAGLDRLLPEEYARFLELNRRYRARFGFPFILAVRGHTKHSILNAFEARLEHDPGQERAAALEEICRIARFRLEALIEEAA